MDAETMADSRMALRSILRDALDASGARWAWQGPPDAPTQWVSDRGPADLDIWWHPYADQEVAVQRVLAVRNPAVVARSDDPRRLRHLSLAFEVDGDLAVVDFTRGDLRVGPVLLFPGDLVTVESDHDGLGPVLAGAAGAADLLIRPLLRGKLPPEARVAAARGRWTAAPEPQRRYAATLWEVELGPLAADIIAVLDGTAPEAELPARARKVLLRRTLAPAGIAAAWAQRWSVVPAGSSAGPLKLRTRGVVVALVGTDGSGKSTVADQLAERLQTLGMATDSAYFGMARGNLPGVGLARKVLGIKQEPAVSAADPVPVPEVEPVPAADPVPAANAVPDLDPEPEPPKLAYPAVRRVAAWFYALEYMWRYASTVAPAVRKRRVVICDRYVYDLRESPWPGSPAAAFVQKLVPPPDVLVLPDAPAELIHARKPERTLSEQARQQREFRALLAEQPARCAELVVDTSGDTADPVAPVVAAVVQAAHRPRSAPRT